MCQTGIYPLDVATYGSDYQYKWDAPICQLTFTRTQPSKLVQASIQFTENLWRFFWKGKNVNTIRTQLQALKTQASVCTACDLSKTRANVVFGSGSATAELVIVAEGPSAADNQTTLPFSGPAGDLLDEVLAANDLTRSQIWLTNIIKCRAASLKGWCSEKPSTESI